MSNKGGVSIPVFEAIFNGSESITSYTREFEESLYKLIPNLYVILVSDNKKNKIVGGIFIKTTYTHNDVDDFYSVITKAVSTSENLKKFQGKQYSYLPARLGVEGTEPLSEDEMLHVLQKQYLKHSTVGRA